MINPLSITFLISLILLAIGLSLYYLHLADLETLIILHFEGRRGADVLGSKTDVLGIIISGLVINALNFGLVSAFYNRRRFFALLLTGANFLVSLLILLAVIAIISVN